MLKRYRSIPTIFKFASSTLSRSSGRLPTSFPQAISRTVSTMSTQTSTCLCKSVEIQVTGTDKGAVLCHCANCQAQSGSAFMHNHRWTRSDMKFTKGEDLVGRYVDKNTKSGNQLTRGFCKNCVSQSRSIDDLSPRSQTLTVVIGLCIVLVEPGLQRADHLDFGNHHWRAVAAFDGAVS